METPKVIEGYEREYKLQCRIIELEEKLEGN